MQGTDPQFDVYSAGYIDETPAGYASISGLGGQFVDALLGQGSSMMAASQPTTGASAAARPFNYSCPLPGQLITGFRAMAVDQALNISGQLVQKELVTQLQVGGACLGQGLTTGLSPRAHPQDILRDWAFNVALLLTECRSPLWPTPHCSLLLPQVLCEVPTDCIWASPSPSPQPAPVPPASTSPQPLPSSAGPLPPSPSPSPKPVWGLNRSPAPEQSSPLASSPSWGLVQPAGLNGVPVDLASPPAEEASPQPAAPGGRCICASCFLLHSRRWNVHNHKILQRRP